MEVVEISSLEAKLKIVRENGRVLHITGRFTADIVQNCVVTLEPVKSHLEDDFESWFADPGQAVSFARARHEKQKLQGESERPMLEEYEDPEPVIDGRINIGEVVAQYLSLAIDPYPHAEGVERVGQDDEQKKEADNPFAKLKALRGDKGEE
jgi:uncharacterized metal-binding protein YceD (DUF177 family)